jgi:adenylate cyclase class IV
LDIIVNAVNSFGEFVRIESGGTFKETFHRLRERCTNVLHEFGISEERLLGKVGSEGVILFGWF